jgi:hypothetical protein
LREHSDEYAIVKLIGPVIDAVHSAVGQAAFVYRRELVVQSPEIRR